MVKMLSTLLGKSVVQFYAKLTSILRSSMCLAGDSVVSSCSGFEIGLWVLEGPSFMRSSGAINRICIKEECDLCTEIIYIINPPKTYY